MTLQSDHTQGPLMVLGGWAFSCEQGHPVNSPVGSKAGPFQALPTVVLGGSSLATYGY